MVLYNTTYALFEYLFSDFFQVKTQCGNDSFRKHLLWTRPMSLTVGKNVTFETCFTTERVKWRFLEDVEALSDKPLMG